MPPVRVLFWWSCGSLISMSCTCATLELLPLFWSTSIKSGLQAVSRRIEIKKSLGSAVLPFGCTAGCLKRDPRSRMSCT